MLKEKSKVWLIDHRHPIFLAGLLTFFILPEILQKIFLWHFPFPLLITVLIVTSILIIQTSPKKKILSYGLIAILLLFLIIWNRYKLHELELTAFILLFIYFSFITYFLFIDLIRSEKITSSVIIGAFAGYFMIGVMAFFVFAFLESAYPDTLNVDLNSEGGIQDTFYFSFITLTTIGYGDFAPTSSLGQRIAILEGLIGQFYIAIVMAIIVGKFLSHKSEN